MNSFLHDISLVKFNITIYVTNNSDRLRDYGTCDSWQVKNVDTSI